MENTEEIKVNYMPEKNEQDVDVPPEPEQDEAKVVNLERKETINQRQPQSFKVDVATRKKSRLIHFYADDCVESVLKAVSLVHPSLHVDYTTKSVLLNRFRKNRVGLLSGGGAGHEPFAIGFVGECMLTCTIMGWVFASPTPQAILSAIKNVSNLNKGGILVIILNNTGDVLNFGIAIEVARSKGIEVESVVIGDDISVYDKEIMSIAGRRGSAGIIFAFKIAGALSSHCCSLSEIALTVHAVNARLASIGVCLETCSLPDKPPMFVIPADDIHIGVGIKGEAGITPHKIMPAPDIVALLVSKLKKSMNLEDGDNLCVIVNDMGGLSSSELFIVTAEVQRALVNNGYNVMRMYSGRLLTSLDTNGFQLCLLNVTGKEEWLPLLDCKTEAFAWPGTRLSHIKDESKPSINFIHDDKQEEVPANAMELDERGGAVMRECLEAICKAFIAEEAKLNELDSGCGDGDTGTTFKMFAKAVLSQMNHLPLKKVGLLFGKLSHISEMEMGGVSGGLYTLLLLGAAKSSQDWLSLWNGAIDLMTQYTDAEPGYRTMLDALVPANLGFCKIVKEKGIKEWRSALKFAVEKAAVGCDSTRDMVARAGRASMVNPALLNDVDPGAYAVVTWLSAIYKALINSTHMNIVSAQKKE